MDTSAPVEALASLDALAEVGLWNAAGASVLALFAIAAARLAKRPALVHALWVLVLLKLVAPALVPIPIPWELSPEGAIASSGAESSSTGLDWGIGERLRPMLAAGVAAVASLRPYVGLLLGIWLGGAAFWFAIAVLRVARFQRTLRGAQPAADELQRHTDRLAESLGLRRAPQLRLTQQPISPMLWALGPYARLIFPAELLTQLSPEARDTLLVHELSHYRRGDHWVRLLELLAAGLYWWHPLVWWGRRQLRQAEEECCDAWVVAQLPQHARHYARALLDTLDYLSDARTAAVAMASEIGGARFVRRRLVMILRGTAPKRLTPRARLAVLVLAAVLLPVLPTFVEPPAATQQAGMQQAVPVAPLQASQDTRETEAESTDGKVAATATDAPAPLDDAQQQVAAPAAEHEQSDTAPEVPPEAPVAAAPNPPPTAEAATDSGPRRASANVADSWATAHSPDGRHSVHAGVDGSITLVDNRSGQQRRLDRCGVTSVAFSPDGRTFATGCWDNRARLWDVETGAELAVLAGHADRVNSVAFSPDGDTLVTGSWDHAVKLWNVATREELAALPRLNQPVNCVRFSPDGQSLAVALGNWKFDEPGQVQIWNLDSLSQRAVLHSESGVGAVVFSPGGEGLAAGETEGRVTLWDLPTSTPWSAYVVPPQSVARAAFWAGMPFASAPPTSPAEPAGA